MRRDILLTVTIDKQSFQLLCQLAEAETEGNRSLLIRNLIREAARSRYSTHGKPLPECGPRAMASECGPVHTLQEVCNE